MSENHGGIRDTDVLNIDELEGPASPFVMPHHILPWRKIAF